LGQVTGWSLGILFAGTLAIFLFGNPLLSDDDRIEVLEGELTRVVNTSEQRSACIRSDEEAANIHCAELALPVDFEVPPDGANVEAGFAEIPWEAGESAGTSRVFIYIHPID
jgi:hypothetical protein